MLIVFVWNLAFRTTRLKKATIVEIKWSARLDCYKIQTTRKLAILDKIVVSHQRLVPKMEGT